jgi:hypothetical protein
MTTTTPDSTTTETEDGRRPPRLPAQTDPRRLADLRTDVYHPMGDWQRAHRDPRDGRRTILTAHTLWLAVMRSFAS